MANVLIQWRAPEFEKYEKSKTWFIVAGIFFLGLIGLSIWMKSPSMIVSFALMGLVIFLFALRKPRQVKFAITSKGIMVNERLYRFDDLKSFWIFYDPPEIKKISFESKKTLKPYIIIPLAEQNPVEVRKILVKFLPEIEQEESVIDVLARRLKF